MNIPSIVRGVALHGFDSRIWCNRANIKWTPEIRNIFRLIVGFILFFVFKFNPTEYATAIYTNILIASNTGCSKLSYLKKFVGERKRKRAKLAIRERENEYSIVFMHHCDDWYSIRVHVRVAGARRHNVVSLLTNRAKGSHLSTCIIRHSSKS